MKNIIERLSLPFFLIVGYLSHILFLFYTEQRIPNIADAIIIGFLSILYGFNMYMGHIKKPDYNQILEDKFNLKHQDILLEINHLKDESKENMKVINGKVGALALQKGMKSSNAAQSLGW